MAQIQKIMPKLEKNLKLFSTLLISLKCLCSGSTVSYSRIVDHVCLNFNKSYYFYKFNKFFWVIRKAESEKEFSYVRPTRVYNLLTKRQNIILKRNIYFYIYFSKLYAFSLSVYFKKKKISPSFKLQKYFVNNIFLKKDSIFFIPSFFSLKLEKFLYYMSNQKFKKKKKTSRFKAKLAWRKNLKSKFLTAKKALNTSNFVYSSLLYCLFIKFLKLIIKNKFLVKKIRYIFFYKKFLNYKLNILEALNNFKNYFNCYLKKVYNNIFFTLTNSSGDVLISISSRNVKLRKKFKFKRKAISIFFTVLPFFLYKIKTKLPHLKKIENLFFFNSFANFVKYKFLSDLFKHGISVYNVKNLKPISHNSFKKLKKQKRR